MKKVLLVDDSEIARWNVKQHFEAAGYAVVEASSGAQGLEQVEANPDLALIVLDYSMPVMNGITFARKLREAKNNIQIAFLSAQASETLKKEAKEVGAVCWALKSISGPALVTLVGKFINPKVS